VNWIALGALLPVGFIVGGVIAAIRHARHPTRFFSEAHPPVCDECGATLDFYTTHAADCPTRTS
jgi:hypothetical protein